MNSAEVPPASGRARLAVLASGRGRTVANLHERANAGALSATIDRVLASRACPAIDRCRTLGLAADVVDADRMSDELERAGVDWVVLAGYTRWLEIPPALRWRVVNIHPALLPSFGGRGMYGDRVHRAVLDAGCRVSGCTVHLCDDEFDRGPIVAQSPCEVRSDDTPDDLAARVFEVERDVYPRALQALFGGYRVEGQRVLLRRPHTG